MGDWEMWEDPEPLDGWDEPEPEPVQGSDETDSLGLPAAISPRSAAALAAAAAGDSDTDDSLLSFPDSPTSASPTRHASQTSSASTPNSQSQPNGASPAQTSAASPPASQSSQPDETSKPPVTSEPAAAKAAAKEARAAAKAEAEAAKAARKRAREEAKASKEAAAAATKRARDGERAARARLAPETCEKFLRTRVADLLLDALPELATQLDAVFEADADVGWERDATIPVPGIAFRRRLLDPETWAESEEWAEHALLVPPFHLVAGMEREPQALLDWLRQSRDALPAARSLTVLNIAFGLGEGGGSRKPKLEAQMRLRVAAERSLGAGWREVASIADLATIIRSFHRSVGQEAGKREKKASSTHLSRDGLRKGVEVGGAPGSQEQRAILKTNLSRALLEVPGIREATANVLAERWGSFRRFAEATQAPDAAATIAAVAIQRGDQRRLVGPALAANLVAYFSTDAAPGQSFRAS